METIGIFQGKQKKHNIAALTLLYDNGPLTAWEMTSKITEIGKQSLHSTLNKRLRILEKKDYLCREESKWHLTFKGIIAALLIDQEPRRWNPIWTKIFENQVQKVENSQIFNKELGLASEKIHDYLKFLGFCPEDFNTWIEFSKKVKSLMSKGVINFDLIKGQTLLSLIIMELNSLEQLTEALKILKNA
jgi:hypothetical protein